MINVSNIHCHSQYSGKNVITASLSSIFFTQLMTGIGLRLNAANSGSHCLRLDPFLSAKPGHFLTPDRWIVPVKIRPLRFYHGEIRKGNITDHFTYTVTGLQHFPRCPPPPWQLLFGEWVTRLMQLGKSGMGTSGPFPMTYLSSTEWRLIREGPVLGFVEGTCFLTSGK